MINNSVPFTVTTTGHVGVGTSNPSKALDVSGIIAVNGQAAINSNAHSILLGDLESGDGNRSLSLWSGDQERVFIGASGFVGIGTNMTGSHKLAVEGSIGAREIRVEATGWSDFVFSSDYELRTLEEVEDYIHQNKHLPEIPGEAEVMERGINLGEMNAKLLQKIEELTLYLIEQNKQNQVQQELIEQLKKEVAVLKNQ